MTDQSTPADKNELRGIGGWLLVLIISMVLIILAQPEKTLHHYCKKLSLPMEPLYQPFGHPKILSGCRLRIDAGGLCGAGLQKWQSASQALVTGTDFQSDAPAYCA